MALSFAMGAAVDPRCSKSILIESGNVLCNYLREPGAQERLIFCGSQFVLMMRAVLGHLLYVSDEKCLISMVGVIQGLCSVKAGRREVWKILVGEGTSDDDDKENSVATAASISMIDDFFTKLHLLLEGSKSIMLLRRVLGLLANASCDEFGQRFIACFQGTGSTFADVIQEQMLTSIPDRQVVLSALSVLSHLADGIEWSQSGWRKVCDLVGCGDVEVACKALECVVRSGSSSSKAGKLALTDLLVCGVITCAL